MKFDILINNSTTKCRNSLSYLCYELRLRYFGTTLVYNFAKFLFSFFLVVCQYMICFIICLLGWHEPYNQLSLLSMKYKSVEHSRNRQQPQSTKQLSYVIEFLFFLCLKSFTKWHSFQFDDSLYFLLNSQNKSPSFEWITALQQGYCLVPLSCHFSSCFYFFIFVIQERTSTIFVFSSCAYSLSIDLNIFIHNLILAFVSQKYLE